MGTQNMKIKTTNIDPYYLHLYLAIYPSAYDGNPENELVWKTNWVTVKTTRLFRASRLGKCFFRLPGNPRFSRGKCAFFCEMSNVEPTFVYGTER